jgi:hypothetical protein
MDQPAATASGSGLLQVQPMSLEQLRKFAEGGYLYGILDACDAPAVPPKMEELGEQRAVSLFRGAAEEQYSAIAPYLVAVDPPMLDWIVETLWKDPWGIFVLAKADLDTLRQHFRRFLIVQLPDGEKWFFRYYDPRIFRVYLPNCNAGELRKFFGAARAFGFKDANESVSLVQCALRPEHPDTVADPVLPWRIRPEHVAALNQAQFEDYRERSIKHLRESFPEVTAPATDDQLRQFVADGVRSAARFNIRREVDVTRFLHLLLAVTPQFEHDPKSKWMLQYLNDASLDAEQRLDLITERLAFAKEVAT